MTQRLSHDGVRDNRWIAALLGGRDPAEIATQIEDETTGLDLIGSQGDRDTYAAVYDRILGPEAAAHPDIAEILFGDETIARVEDELSPNYEDAIIASAHAQIIQWEATEQIPDNGDGLSKALPWYQTHMGSFIYFALEHIHENKMRFTDDQLAGRIALSADASLAFAYRVRDDQASAGLRLYSADGTPSIVIFGATMPKYRAFRALQRNAMAHFSRDQDLSFRWIGPDYAGNSSAFDAITNDQLSDASLLWKPK